MENETHSASQEGFVRVSEVVERLEAVKPVLLGEHDKHIESIIANMKTAMIEAVRGCSNVDAIEVVRCKECRFCHKEPLAWPQGVVQYFCRHLGANDLKAPTYFCYFGERRA